MQTRGTRLILLAVLIAVGVGAGLLTWNAQQQAAALRREQGEVAARLDALIDVTTRLGNAQHAYVAPGQPEGPWLEQFASLVQRLSDGIAIVRPLTRSREAADALRQAGERTATLVDIDQRVRGHLRNDESLLAADLIFADGRTTLDAIAAPLRALAQSERAAFEAEHAAALQRVWLILGVAAALWTVGLGLLVRVPAAPPAVEAPVSPPRSELSDLALKPVSDAPAASLNPAPATPAVDLAAAADVCTELSRLTSVAALPGVLARAAAVLDASGLIVWMGAGEELFAVTAHGYDARVIKGLGPLGRNADNATAACWRTGDIGSVAGDVLSNGAIVAPMFGPDACVGVLAAEVRNRREDDPAVRAVTAMIAAQLATAVAAWPAASSASVPAATGT